MAVDLTVARSTVVTGDVDLDGVADPGDTITTTVTVSNLGADAATGLTVDDALNGSTQTGQATVTPIGFNDSYSLTGTPRSRSPRRKECSPTTLTRTARKPRSPRST